MEFEFQEFPKIKKYNDLFCTVTEKIHGTNAQILIRDGEIRAGSRTRWLTRFDDNYGFASWVEDNAEQLKESLGHGRHFGEWYGPGVNSGYNLKEKRLALFNTSRPYSTLPERVDIVPVLYEGVYSAEAIQAVAEKLRSEGSAIAPGFMNPEGLVIYYPEVDLRRKLVFKAEETGWKKGDGGPNQSYRIPRDELFELVAPYLQSIRLEKLLMRDSRLKENYPQSIQEIVKLYREDLESEMEIPEGMKKPLQKAVFPWIKQMIEASL